VSAASASAASSGSAITSQALIDVLDNFETTAFSLPAAGTGIPARSGGWYAYGPQASATDAGAAAFTIVHSAVTGGAPGSTKAVEAACAVAIQSYAGVGTNLSGGAAYDVSNGGKNTGVAFWLKSGSAAASIDFHFVTADNEWRYVASVTTAWKQYVIPFASLTPKTSPATWDPAKVTAIQFGINAGSPVDLFIDDVGFYVSSSNSSAAASSSAAGASSSAAVASSSAAVASSSAAASSADASSAAASSADASSSPAP
jgi:hypothetical protein